MDSIALQWLTFAVMILIQGVAAASVVTSLKVTLTAHHEQLKDHEARLRYIEHQEHIRSGVRVWGGGDNQA
jgi:hypothetical protein